MGIYDRDYYREDRRSIFDPFTARTQVTITLVIINAVVFVVQLMTREFDRFGFARGYGEFTALFALDVSRVLDGEVWRLFTGAFLHNPWGWSHIVFNMVILWWAGSMVEDIYGSREFLGFYVVAVLFSSLAYVGWNVAQGRPYHVAFGASGAVTAVLVTFACHYPHRTVLLFFLVPVPVWALVIFQVATDTFGVLGVVRQPIGHAAHLGGAAFGFLYHYYQWRVTNWLPSFGGLGGASRSRPRARRGVRVFQPDPEAEPGPAAPGGEAAAPAAAPVAPTAGGQPVDEHLEAKLDEVLEKVQRYGQDSLSESEREILHRASEIYRRRRQG